MKTNRLTILLVVLLLGACGPIYETQYSYTAPEGPQGQMCVSQCEMHRMNCEQLEDMKKQNCDANAAREYDYCRYHTDEKYCYQESCSVDYSRCERLYNTCYQGCGGRVDAHQVCVAFCEQK